ncbi:MAG TPA: exopolysaccharide biosynthesis polyprenyl glycosylphosphotransferase [Acetobacteraceae bacterium]|nr:exopolysaccharide biosynthesis polyprenyl glycosylphosphotransferase [Acetobacteraceae bacterium]
MSQFVGRHVAPEMLALGLLELLLTFALAYILLTPAAGGFVLEAKAANHALVVALTVGFIAFTIGLYRPQIFQRARSLVLNTILSAFLAFPAVWGMSKAMGLGEYWPVGYDALRPVKIVLIWTGALVAIRFLFLAAVRLNLFVHRVAIVGPADAPSTAAAVRSGRKGFLEIAVVRPEQASATSLGAARVHTLVFSARAAEKLPPAIVDEYARRSIRVESEREFWERHLKRIDISNLDESWLAEIDRRREPRFIALMTRLGDIVTSIVFLVVMLPIMLLVALLVRLDSPGPVLYRQERVGLNGKPFTLMKFRSMRVNAEARGPAWAEQRDPRVTRVGSFMRRARIDELPQLFNILRGEMSFIGPRPERPHFVEQLAQAIPFYRERARVKPGLTGWAQVNYPYGASVEDARAKLSYDLYYVKNRSPLLDLLILFSTVRVILFQEGAR